MTISLAPNVENIPPLPPAKSLVDISQWQVDRGRRDAPGGGVNGQAGDHWPGPPMLYPWDMPFTRMLPPPAYGLRQSGNPLQTPSQPYRNAGLFYASNTRMYPQPRSAGSLGRFIHQPGGSQTGGVTTALLQQRIAAALSMINARKG